MFSLSSEHTFHLYSKSTDMRKGFNGLCGLIHNHLGQNASSGDVYLFINKRRNKIKLLRWEKGGFVLYYKRLEAGTFTLPETQDKASIQIKWRDLVHLIDGIVIEKYKCNQRYDN